MAHRASPEHRVSELREQIRRADHLYYNLGQPELTDAEYDRRFEELRQLEDAHPELRTPDSPTQRVGAPLAKGTRFATAEHLVPMLSIESLTSEAQVREFDERTRRSLGLADDAPLQWTVEPKLDGVSANLLYEHGVLVRGLSRGDGNLGEDVTQNLRTIRNLPLRLDTETPPARIEVRGEVILSRDAFEALREGAETTTETPFRNARNAAAGTLKLLDPAIVARRRLEFMAWGVGFREGGEVATFAELHRQLAGYGFKMATPFEVVDDVEGVLEYHRKMEATRDDSRYEMDGIVAKVDRLDLQRRLGRTARSPRWLLAYKFTARNATTVVDAIDAQVGRTGAITPVAHLQPVELGGVTVRRATLHNWGLLAERDVRVGDHVEIERAGDVIPEVVRVLTERRPRDSKPVHPPKTCPSCHSPLSQEGSFLYCLDVDCPAQLRGRVAHLANRRALDIDRLGPKYIDQLMEAGLLKRVEDVFTLPERREEILALERWGERSYERLAEEIENAKAPTLDRLIYGLGIRHVGEQTARDLAAAFPDLDALRDAGEEALLEVDGVGPEVAGSIRAFFALAGNQRFLREAHHAGLQPRPAAAPRDVGPLKGRVFCFTGTLEGMTRDEAKAHVTGLGGKVAASITKKVTDVVIGESAGSKAAKAERLGLHTLTEPEFVKLIESHR